MKIPETSSPFAYNQTGYSGKANTDTLKGVKLSKAESLDHILFNLRSNSIFSKDMYSDECDTKEKIKDMVQQLTNTCGGG